MRNKLKFLEAAGLAVLLSVNWAHAESVKDRLDKAEGTIDILEESVNDLNKEMENRMRVSGYADVEYNVAKDKDSSFRMHHMSIFFQKKISDKWKFFSEIEYEDGPKYDNEGGKTITVLTPDSTGNVYNPQATEIYHLEAGDGKIFLEAINIDHMWTPQMSFRAGRFYTPAGIWSVNHYPPFVPTQVRPGHIRQVFPQIIDGAMAYGTLQFGDHFFTYNAYLSNGEGNAGNEDKNSGKAVGIKASALLNVPVVSHAEVGASFYQDPEDSAAFNNQKTAWGLHTKFKYKDFKFQAELASAKFRKGDQPRGNVSGYYAQVLWEPSAWGFGGRYDVYNADHSVAGETTTDSFFLNYHFNTNLVFKAEHHVIDNAGTPSYKTIFSIVTYLE